MSTKKKKSSGDHPSDGSVETSSFLHHLKTGNGDDGGDQGDDHPSQGAEKHGPAHPQHTKVHQVRRVRLLLLITVLGVVIGYYIYGLVGDRASDILGLKERWQHLQDRTFSVDGRLDRLETGLSSMEKTLEAVKGQALSLGALQGRLDRLERRFHDQDQCTRWLQRLDARVMAGESFQDVVTGLLSSLPPASPMVLPLRTLETFGEVRLWSREEYIQKINEMDHNRPQGKKGGNVIKDVTEGDLGASVGGAHGDDPLEGYPRAQDDLASLLGRLEKTATQFLSDHLKIHPTGAPLPHGSVGMGNDRQDQELMGMLRTALWTDHYRAAHGIWRTLSVKTQEALGAPFAQQLAIRVLLDDINRLKIYGFPYGPMDHGDVPFNAENTSDPVNAVDTGKNGAMLP